MIARRTWTSDVLAGFAALLVVGLDQWSKRLVVAHLGPPDLGPHVSLIGSYLSLYYTRNRGAAFRMFSSNGPALFVLVAIAIAVIVFLYLRMYKTGSLLSKLAFGLILGGAVGNNVFDRLINGSVVDFIWFQIPQIGFSFAIFNLADAAITVGVILLSLTLLLAGKRIKDEARKMQSPLSNPTSNV